MCDDETVTWFKEVAGEMGGGENVINELMDDDVI